MKRYTLDDLERDSEKERKRLKDRMYNNYHLARKLGFSVQEAVVLRVRKEETIIALAKERGLGDAKKMG